MPVILSITPTESGWLTAGPEGLYRYENDIFSPISQPQEQLVCALQLNNLILVGGAPHGIAISPDSGQTWHPAYIKHGDEKVVSIAADPEWDVTGTLLTSTFGQGIFRSEDRGWRWVSCNFGLHTYNILCIAWATPLPKFAYPKWEIAFAGGDDGIYRSPNGGRGWKRSNGNPEHVQIIVPDRDFHRTGIVLAGTESDGLWRSDDGGYSFNRIAQEPNCINALVQSDSHWILSDDSRLYQSGDGLNWTPIPDSKPALVLATNGNTFFAGDDGGILPVSTIELI